MTNCETESANSSSARALSFRIGDITIGVSSYDDRLKLCVHGDEKRFLVSNSNADVNLKARYGELRALPSGDELFDSGSLWKLYRTLCSGVAGPTVGPGLAPASDGPNLAPDYLFRFTSPFYGPLPYKQACFNPDFTAGEIVLRADYFDLGQGVDALEYPLSELLIVNLLAQGRGVEVHACGVQDSDGRGYLFLGQSGAGKTTIAKLWCRADPRVGQAGASHGPAVLSDDRIILRSLEGRTWMYGTPWHGEAELASPARVPLSRIFFLQQRPKNVLGPLVGAAAVARLMACSFVPFYSPSGLSFALAFCQQVTETVPCCDLGFVPDSRVVEFVRNM
jgi:hypothetical protein